MCDYKVLKERSKIRAKVRCHNETFDACPAIHGATKNNFKPAVTGMLQTLTSKVKAKDLVLPILRSKSALSKRLEETCHKNWQREYYTSNANMLRS